MTGGDGAGDGAVMVLAAWFDEGALRVRMTAADGLGSPTRPVGVAGGVDDACDLVRHWLEGLGDAAGGAHPAR